VTTVVAGNCGVGFAPVLPHHRERLIELMEGIEDIPGTALHEGLSWDWTSFSEYLTAVDRIPHDVDFATQVPHAAVRVHVMGERALAGSVASPDEVRQMAQVVGEAVHAGALGFSTSRTRNHKSVTGEPTPSYGVGAEELLAIARAVGATGTGVLQLAIDLFDLDEDFALMEGMVHASGRPLSLSLVQSPVQPLQFREVLKRIDAANASGLPMRAQVATRGVGLLMGLACTLHPLMSNPVWKRISGLAPDQQAEAMANAEFRTTVLRAQDEAPEGNRIGGGLITCYDLMYEVSDPPCYEPAPSESIAARAKRAGVTPLELVYDLLRQDSGRGMLYVFMANFADGTLDAVHEMLVHEHAVPGLSDGGAHVGSICDGSFPTTLLEHWVLRRPGPRLSLEFAVERQTRATARALGLLDRGVIAPGYRADLNVIDLDNLKLHRPEMRYDLPANGRRLVQRAEGYVHTFVRGCETYRSGEATGLLPGRVVRGATPVPRA